MEETIAYVKVRLVIQHAPGADVLDVLHNMDYSFDASPFTDAKITSTEIVDQEVK